MIKVLFIPTNSKDSNRVSFTEEMRAIKGRLRSPGTRQRFSFDQGWALTIDGLRNTFESFRPNIIHITGQGNSERRIHLQNTMGQDILINPKTLGSILSILKGDIRCVVLNACVTLEQAQEIYRAVGCVIGVPSTLTEKLSISFCTSLYKLFSEGMNIRDAFSLASHELDLERLDKGSWPLLLISTEVDKGSLYLEKRKRTQKTSGVDPSFSTLDFGAPAAERDINKGLKDYFVESDTFRRVSSGEKFIILGNRGSGKSAIFKITAERERDAGNLVIELSPEDYSYEMLSTLMAREQSGAWVKYGAYAAAWKYLIYVLVMKELTQSRSNLKTGAASEIYAYLRDNHKGFQGNPIAVLISYLKRMEGSKLGAYEASLKSRELTKLYRLEEIYSLLPAVKELCDEQRVLVLVDELDRGWDASEDAKAFVAGLFQAVVSINELTPNLRVFVSLRMELYDSIPSLYEDAQKYRDVMEIISWDETSLFQLIAKRIRHTVPGLASSSDTESWNSVFAETLDYRQAKSFNYLVDRTLFRPREMILLCTIALEESRKSQIWPIDYPVITKAELVYSEDRTKDIVAEYRFQYPGLMSIFDAFRGRPYTMSRDELEQICFSITTGDYGVERSANWAIEQDPEYLIETLWRIGFLRAQAVGGVKGVRRSGSSYIGSYQVSSLNLRNIPRFQVHSMFRAFLGLKESRDVPQGSTSNTEGFRSGAN